MKNTVFEEVERSGCNVKYGALSGGVTVGYARISENMPIDRCCEILGIWLNDEFRAHIKISEMAECFFGFLKSRGFTELYMESEDIDDGDAFGFKLDDWDNSGWYPKYKFIRKL